MRTCAMPGQFGWHPLLLAGRRRAILIMCMSFLALVMRAPAAVGAELKLAHGASIWQATDAATVRPAMGLPFCFARKLHQELRVPVGLIQVAVGATPQTAWCPRGVLDQVAVETGSELTCKSLFRKAEERQAQAQGRLKSWDEYARNYAIWRREHKGGYTDAGFRVYPCVLFNAQVHPLIPFAFRGMIWHQGEGGPHQEHAERMAALIAGRRDIFLGSWFVRRLPRFAAHRSVA